MKHWISSISFEFMHLVVGHFYLLKVALGQTAVMILLVGFTRKGTVDGLHASTYKSGLNSD